MFFLLSQADVGCWSSKMQLGGDNPFWEDYGPLQNDNI